ncbi:MAG TPA: hypothetical protein VFZ09_43275 [Archangium sp.]|uniref:hypothetical protein n=1 Tax=Archangium sp. TaxID=1872627 RepID=UPI002E35E9B1|nr:hypothetical protein [Archangium sp.]HEX5753102.1 hypothetical protein [Archangium sp.]
MTRITLVNQVPASSAASAEFRLLQGVQHQHMAVRVGVHAGGEASIPTQGSGYTAVAVTQMEDMTLTSNEVSFSGSSQVLVAQVVAENGFYDFRLVAYPGTQVSAIVCENTWRAPVQMTIKQTGTPVAVVTVVDEHNQTSVSTAQQWQCYAIVNGITTATVEFKGPNARVTLTSDGDDSYALAVEKVGPQGTSLEPLASKPAETETAAPAEAPVLSVTSAA